MMEVVVIEDPVHNEMDDIERGNWAQIVQVLGDLRTQLNDLRGAAMVRPTMTLGQVADALNREKTTLASRLSREPNHWLHACAVRGERGLYHTHLVRQHLAGDEAIDWS